jgi:hypothetical protein
MGFTPQVSDFARVGLPDNIASQASEFSGGAEFATFRLIHRG